MMSNSCQADNNVDVSSSTQQTSHCSTYSFPEGRDNRGHLRSISHGNSTSLVGNNPIAIVGRPSALKGTRGHQRAFSQGQIGAEFNRSGHNRVGSKTDFILPPGHKDPKHVSNSFSKVSSKGHNRQASTSESIYTLRRTAPPPLWRRIGHILLRRRITPDSEDRFKIIVPNHLIPSNTSRKAHPNGGRPNNKIRTSKYTLLSFLPRNLLEQFHRIANLYFIFIVLLNWFPAINAFGKEIAMLPVLFVLGVTAIKDLFEDRRRHASDKRINNSTCRIYKSEIQRYKKIFWKDLRVGDIIHLSNNEVVPADILLLRSSDVGGLCYIDTGHLDGETNLKQRQVARGFVEKQQIFDPSKFRSSIEVEAPTTKIYRFHGAIIHSNGKRVPIATENIVLRECLLKNTDFVEGIVIYAGHETKALLNNGGPRYKRSSLERQMNQDVLWCVLILIFLCFISAIGCKFWVGFFSRQGPPFKTSYSENIEAILAFWTYVIILQIMIPLSLYVTLELCKIIQVYHIHHSMELYDPIIDKGTECRALNITEELGQIQYIFSDKTGTLTQNKMIFRRCTIAGVSYDHFKMKNEHNLGRPSLSVAVNKQLISDLKQVGLNPEIVYSSREDHSRAIREFFLHLSICNTVICSQQQHFDMMNASGFVVSSKSCFSNSALDNYSNLNNSSSAFVARSALQKEKNIDSNNDDYINPTGTTNLTDEEKAKLRGFNTAKPIFEAESPDELALVDTAFNYNCGLLKRTLSSVTIDYFDQEILTFEILDILPFDSTRKKMSVIVKNPITNEIVLFCKGADTSIFPYLAPILEHSEQQKIKDKTERFVQEYSKEGLRILLMAKRVLTTDEYFEWSTKHQEMKLSFENLEKRTQDSFSTIECNLTLLGATGIEDRLQEGVPETLSALIEAGIVVWVLTGDKPETAINIAYSSKLFSPQMEVLTLMTLTKETAENTIQSYLSDIANSLPKNQLQSPVLHNLSNRPSMLKQNQKALVVDGKTLTYILDRRANLTKPFLNLTRHCASVLCCRATPLQKAYIVKVVKEELKMRTLAIGDGANDVSMIQTADVGIGISGQEGTQAVMAADFALSRFKYLEPLLLVHGHWCYDRLSRMVLYFFYKNAAFVFLVFWYQLYNGFSGSVMIDQMYLMLYNLLFTSLPPMAIGIYDQVVSRELLLEKPFLYREGRLSEVYKTHSFWITIGDAIYQSLSVFFITLCAYRDSDIDMYEFGATIITVCMFMMLLHLGIEIRCWTIIHVICIVISITGFYVYSFIYNSVCVNCFGLPSTYWTIHHAIARPSYWLITLLACIVSLLPRFTIRVLKTSFLPDVITKSVIHFREATREGNEFLVSWSRSTSVSSIYRRNNGQQENILTSVE